MARLVRYVSPMPRHRKAPYGAWRAEIEAVLAADEQGASARLLNSAALLFAEHHRQAEALDCLLAQLVLVEHGALAAGEELDAFANLVRLSMFEETGEARALTFWLDAVEGRENRGDLEWLSRRAVCWGEVVVDTLVQEALRKTSFANRRRLLDAAADIAPELPAPSRTLRQEFLERSGAGGMIVDRTEVFAHVVSPLIDAARDERHATESAARACAGLCNLADRIDGGWWRAIAATAAGLPATSAWLDDQVAAFLEREPLLAATLPPHLSRRFVDPADLRNDRLSAVDLDALGRSISARLAIYPGVSDRIGRYAETCRRRLPAPMTMT